MSFQRPGFSSPVEHLSRPVSLRVYNAFTVDVEDYFHTEAMTQIVPRKSWCSVPSRVETNTRRIFEILQRHGVRATFFFLGWVAERFPNLVREAAELGHEIGCHSYWHRPVFSLTPSQFKDDTLRSKQVIEDAVGTPIVGYRAPSFSILASTSWAFDILAELGFLYDSSTHPVSHDIYGNPSAPRTPFLTGAGNLAEFPITTLRFLSRNYPFAGGGYFRTLPYLCVKKGFELVNKSEHMNAIFYIHPWELDSNQPRLQAQLRSRIRQYIGLSSTARKLERLLSDFQFVSIRDLYMERFGPNNRVVKHTANNRVVEHTVEDNCFVSVRAD